MRVALNIDHDKCRAGGNFRAAKVLTTKDDHGQKTREDRP
jgi:hypothetical protein